MSDSLHTHSQWSYYVWMLNYLYWRKKIKLRNIEIEKKSIEKEFFFSSLFHLILYIFVLSSCASLLLRRKDGTTRVLRRKVLTGLHNLKKENLLRSSIDVVLPPRSNVKENIDILRFIRSGKILSLDSNNKLSFCETFDHRE